MNRRNFLKSLVGAAVAAAFPPLAQGALALPLPEGPTFTISGVDQFGNSVVEQATGGVSAMAWTSVHTITWSPA